MYTFVQAVKIDLKTQTTLYLTVFIIALASQLVLINVQAKSVVEPVSRAQSRIQAISNAMGNAEAAESVLEDFRWEYGSRENLIAALDTAISEISAEIYTIEPDTAEMESYLLGRAVRTTFSSFTGLCRELEALLTAGDTEGAADLYYRDLGPCAGYLNQYLQEYLASIIELERSAYEKILALQEGIRIANSITALCCIVLAAFVVISMRNLMKTVLSMADASASISSGDFFIEDISIRGPLEFKQVETALNEMKNNMRHHVELLEERTRIETELHRKETEALELQALLEREKLLSLKSQIHPHFLFNTLNAIKYTADNECAASTSRLLTALSRIFRYSLGSFSDKVPLSGEIRIINDYFALIAARFGEKVQMAWSLDPSLDLTTAYIPPFIIQPIVENAIKHGLAKKENGGKVLIDIKAEASILAIKVSDDGIGMSEERLSAVLDSMNAGSHEGYESIGLYNIAARLRMMGPECGITVTSRENEGTVISIRLIYEEKEDV